MEDNFKIQTQNVSFQCHNAKLKGSSAQINVMRGFDEKTHFKVANVRSSSRAALRVCLGNRQFYKPKEKTTLDIRLYLNKFVIVSSEQITICFMPPKNFLKVLEL